MIKAIIFDCFGVLLVDLKQSLIEMFPDKAKEIGELHRQADAGFLDRKDLLEQLSELLDSDEEKIVKIFKSEHVINKPLVEFIKLLKEQSYKVGMLSNLGRGWFDEFLPEQEIRSLFDDIIISGEVGVYKPHAEIYELGCQRLDLKPEEIVFVDDRKENCDGAELIGMKSVHFTSVNDLKLELKQFGV